VLVLLKPRNLEIVVLLKCRVEILEATQISTRDSSSFEVEVDPISISVSSILLINFISDETDVGVINIHGNGHCRGTLSTGRLLLSLEYAISIIKCDYTRYHKVNWVVGCR